MDIQIVIEVQITMTRKNINVSEVVHEKLSLEKRKEETFDDVLKRELNILPSGINDLVAFYPDDLANAARLIVNCIENQADFERAISEYEEYYALEFDHPESGHTIVKVQFREDPTDGTHAVYRDHHGEMKELVRAYIPDTEDPMLETAFITPVTEGGERPFEEILVDEDLEPRLQNKISGSYERWG